MAELPGIVVRAATALGLDPAKLGSLRGASGSSWDAGPGVLRVGRRDVLDRELAAAAAAAAVLPVPTVLDQAGFGEHTALLLERLPGRPAGELAMGGPEQARAAGLACGRVHDLLAGVPAPAGLRTVPGAPGTDGPARLLHLDLHPLNVLVSDDGAVVTGVLDWANAAAGDPVLDRARTWAILNLDPMANSAARALPSWAALSGGWSQAGRLDDLPAAARAWACRYLLADLASRYSPAELAHARRVLGELA